MTGSQLRNASIPGLLVCAALLAVPSPARAECVSLHAKNVFDNPLVELVFAGSVVASTHVADLGIRVSFDVAKIWKGTVPKRIDLYVWELAPEHPTFEVGKYHVVVAQRMTDAKARRGVGIAEGDIVVFTPTVCSDSLVQDIEQELGPFYAPK